MATATSHQRSTLAVAARSTAGLLLWSGGVLILGALYGTEDLLLQGLVALALLPFMWWHFIAGGEHNTPQSWTLPCICW